MAALAIAVGAANALPVAAADPAASGEPVTLTFVTFVPDRYYQPLFEAYRKDHPNVTFNVEPISLESSVSGVEQRIANGDDTFDMFLSDASWTADFGSHGTALDLTDTAYGVAAKAAPPASTALPASILDTATYEGRLIAAPLWISYQALLYNKDLLEQAGIPFPSSDPTSSITFEELFELAQQAQAAGAKYGLCWDQPDQYYARQPMIESAGGGSGLTGPDYLTPDVTNEGWVKGLTYYQDVFARGLCPQGVPNGQMDPIWNAGDVAFYIAQAPVQGTVDATDFRYGVAPVPGFADGRPVSPSGSHGIAVNPNSPNTEAAIDFLTFASLTPAGGMAATELINQPVLPAATTARLNANIKADPRLQGLSQIVKYTVDNLSVARPPSPKYNTFELATTKAIMDIRNGADVTATLADLQEDLQQLLSR